MSKSSQLEALFNRYKEEFEGREIVLGEGDMDSALMLVGEAPGKDEVRLSRPFVGTAGKNLSEFLDILGLKREFVFVDNAIKYRLSKVNEKTGRVINRPAAKEEIEKNRSYLLEEISIIRPKYIVTLGNVPLKSVTGDYNISIGSYHGKLDKIKVLDSEYSLYPLYHPASIIYNNSLKEVYKKDLINLKAILSV
jgi:DNA polymerase